MILVLVRKTAKKKTNILDLLLFDYDFNYLNPQGTLDAMNFQKWELFSASPGITICWATGLFHQGMHKLSWFTITHKHFDKNFLNKLKYAAVPD